MEKKYAFVLALLLSSLIFCNIFFISFVSTKDKINKEKAIISEIIDGDTIELKDGRIIRLLNINSPEKGTIGADLSKEFLKEFENKTIEIEIAGTDKYERNLARIYALDYLNLKIVELGLASKFLVNKNELNSFMKAEEKAIKNGLGIWKKSEFFGCFNSEINANEEFVVLKNKCDKISIKNWHLKDESRKIYTFKENYFKTIRLNSFQGIDNSTDFFWNSKDNIWNNDRDTLYLFDETGGIVHYETYGY